jgi:poly-beta-1,6-N-acetyl-D-glucosamine synthase
MTAISAQPESRGRGPAVSPTLRIACIVSFLNEDRHLRRFLDSVERQRRLPDELLLVDDGSSDASPQIADEFTRRHARAVLLRRPPRPPARDRLADAAVVRAFQWALTQIPGSWDVAVKMDADLELSPDLFATIEQAFIDDPDLGIAGAQLCVIDPQTGERQREWCRPGHVRGPTKFYRRACYEQVAPLPTFLGWDTIDEITARSRGWRTASIDCASGDTVHLRPVGGHDGALRAQFRWGTAAYAIGQHPLWVAGSALRRLADRPLWVGSAAFLAGWLTGPLRRHPRADAEVRAFGRAEQLRNVQQMMRALRRGLRGRTVENVQAG